MASPAIEATAATNGSTAAASHAVTLPATVSAGAQLMIVGRVTGAGAVAITGGGWTITQNSADASDDVTFWAYKDALAVGNEDGTTVTVTHGASLKLAAVSMSITGAEDPATQAPQSSTVATGTSTTPNPTTVTPTGGSKDYLFIWAGGWEGEQTSPPASNPTNYALNKTGANTGTGGAVATNSRVAIAARQLTAASDDPGSWTISVSDDWTAWALAVHPAGAGNQNINATGLASAAAFGAASFSGGDVPSIPEVISHEQVAPHSSANTGSTSLTVPSDAEGVLVFVHGYEPVADYFDGGTLTLGGTAMEPLEVPGDDNTAAFMGAAFWQPSPATGSQTLAWDWLGTTAADVNPVFHAVYVKGNDTSAAAAALRDFDGAQMTSGSSVSTPTMTALSSDLLVAFGWQFWGGTDQTFSWTNATKVLDTTGSDDGRASIATALPTGDQSVTLTSSNSGGDGGVIGVVIKPGVAAGGGNINVTGLASASAFGTPSFSPGNAPLAVTGLDSASAFGTATLAPGGINAAVTGLASASAFGADTLSPGNVDIAVAGLDSAGAFGTPALSPGNADIAATGLASASGFGTATLSQGGEPQDLTVTGLDSASAFGSATLAAGGINAPVVGLDSASAFGAASLAPGGIDVAAGGLASAGAFGDTSLAPGTALLSPSGLASASAFGAPTLSPGNVDLTISGLASASEFGVTAIGGGTTIPVAGLPSASAFGTPSWAVGNADLAVTGLGSSSEFGNATIDGGVPQTFNPAVHGGKHR